MIRFLQADAYTSAKKFKEVDADVLSLRDLINFKGRMEVKVDALENVKYETLTPSHKAEELAFKNTSRILHEGYFTNAPWKQKSSQDQAHQTSQADIKWVSKDMHNIQGACGVTESSWIEPHHLNMNSRVLFLQHFVSSRCSRCSRRTTTASLKDFQETSPRP